MLTFNEAFKEIYDPVMIAKGFARKGKIYHKLVNNQIMQMLSYCTFGHKCYTIQFEISALCAGNEYEVFMDGERLSEILRINEWEYEYDEYLQQLPQTLSLSQEFIFPCFDACIDYKSYVENMNKMYGVWLGDKIKGEQFSESGMYDINLFLGNYATAQKIREKQIEQNLSAFRSNWGTEIHPSPTKQKEFEDMRNSYYRMKKAMDNNDREYIEAYIKSNEEYSLQSYIKNFYGKKTYDKYLATKQWPLAE